MFVQLTQKQLESLIQFHLSKVNWDKSVMTPQLFAYHLEISDQLKKALTESTGKGHLGTLTAEEVNFLVQEQIATRRSTGERNLYLQRQEADEIIKDLASDLNRAENSKCNLRFFLREYVTPEMIIESFKKDGFAILSSSEPEHGVLLLRISWGAPEQSPEYKKPYLGVALSTTPNGPVIDFVETHGPAFKVGVQRGDVILKFNETAVSDSGDVCSLVDSTPAGTTVKLTVHRDGVGPLVFFPVIEQNTRNWL